MKTRLSLQSKTLSCYFAFCAKTSRAISSSERTYETYNTDYSDVPTILRSRCRLDRLRFMIHGIGKVSIWDTPHYAFITDCDQLDTYSRYIEEHYGSAEVQPSISRFRDLENHLNRYPQRKVLLTRSEIPYSKWLRVIDGTHRAAYAALRGDKYVDVVVTTL